MYFDRDAKGYISIDDIKYALLEFGVDEEMVRTKYIELLLNRYVNSKHTLTKDSMKYSDYLNMMLPKNREFSDLAINRMPVYSDYFSQHNDAEHRNHKELSGYAHQKLRDMVRSMFETMMSNLCELQSSVSPGLDLSLIHI